MDEICQVSGKQLYAQAVGVGGIDIVFRPVLMEGHHRHDEVDREIQQLLYRYKDDGMEFKPTFFGVFSFAKCVLQLQEMQLDS